MAGLGEEVAGLARARRGAGAGGGAGGGAAGRARTGGAGAGLIHFDQLRLALPHHVGDGVVGHGDGGDVELHLGAEGGCAG